MRQLKARVACSGLVRLELKTVSSQSIVSIKCPFVSTKFDIPGRRSSWAEMVGDLNITDGDWNSDQLE